MIHQCRLCCSLALATNTAQPCLHLLSVAPLRCPPSSFAPLFCPPRLLPSPASPLRPAPLRPLPPPRIPLRLPVGLMKFSALSFVPAYTVLYIVSSTSVGLFFYQEWKQLNGTQWGMFSLGFVLILTSLAILAFKSKAALKRASSDASSIYAAAGTDSDDPATPPRDEAKGKPKEEGGEKGEKRSRSPLPLPTPDGRPIVGSCDSEAEEQHVVTVLGGGNEERGHSSHKSVVSTSDVLAQEADMEMTPHAARG